jgi:paraquat-inducible protein B
LGSWECACFDSQTGHINAYELLEFQRINKQKAAKRNVDYFQRVCDATIMRAQLVTQSMITGQLMIEIEMRPDTPIDLKNLDEGYQEIPTILSALAKLSKSLERLDLNKINASLTSILASVDMLLKNPDINASLAELKGALQDARGLVQHVDAKVDPLTDNLNSTIKDKSNANTF